MSSPNPNRDVIGVSGAGEGPSPTFHLSRETVALLQALQRQLQQNPPHSGAPQGVVAEDEAEAAIPVMAPREGAPGADTSPSSALFRRLRSTQHNSTPSPPQAAPSPSAMGHGEHTGGEGPRTDVVAQLFSERASASPPGDGIPPQTPVSSTHHELPVVPAASIAGSGADFDRMLQRILSAHVCALWRLPADTLVAVLEFLPVPTIVSRVQRVCRRLRRLIAMRPRLRRLLAAGCGLFFEFGGKPEGYWTQPATGGEHYTGAVDVSLRGRLVVPIPCLQRYRRLLASPFPATHGRSAPALARSSASSISSPEGSAKAAAAIAGHDNGPVPDDQWTLSFSSGVDSSLVLATTFVYNRRIIVFGGKHYRTDFPYDKRLCNVAAYDPVQDRWQSLPPLRTRRSACSGAFCDYDRRIYIFGGFDGTTEHDTVEVFDPALGNWVMGGDSRLHSLLHPQGTPARLLDGTPVTRTRPVTTAIDTPPPPPAQASSSPSHVDPTQAPTTPTATAAPPPPPLPLPRLRPPLIAPYAFCEGAAASQGPYVYLSGGTLQRNHPDEYHVSTVVALDVRSGEWSRLPDLPESRYLHFSTVLAARVVHTAGGTATMGGGMASNAGPHMGGVFDGAGPQAPPLVHPPPPTTDGPGDEYISILAVIGGRNGKKPVLLLHIHSPASEGAGAVGSAQWVGAAAGSLDESVVGRLAHSDVVGVVPHPDGRRCFVVSRTLGVLLCWVEAHALPAEGGADMRPWASERDEELAGPAPHEEQQHGTGAVGSDNDGDGSVMDDYFPPQRPHMSQTATDALFGSSVSQGGLGSSQAHDGGIMASGASAGGGGGVLESSSRGALMSSDPPLWTAPPPLPPLTSANTAPATSSGLVYHSSGGTATSVVAPAAGGNSNALAHLSRLSNTITLAAQARRTPLGQRNASAPTYAHDDRTGTSGAAVPFSSSGGGALTGSDTFYYSSSSGMRTGPSHRHAANASAYYGGGGVLAGFGGGPFPYGAGLGIGAAPGSGATAHMAATSTPLPPAPSPDDAQHHSARATSPPQGPTALGSLRSTSATTGANSAGRRPPARPRRFVLVWRQMVLDSAAPTPPVPCAYFC